MKNKTIKRNLEIYDLHQSGTDITMLSCLYGISEKYIASIISDVSTGIIGRASQVACVYPQIEKWLKDNDLTVSAFHKMITDKYKTNACCASALRYALSGKNTTLHVIKQILGVTGLTFEEVFYE